jgi:inward rectifier potassium channel
MVDIPKGARQVRQPQGYSFWIVGDERMILRDAYHSFLRARWSVSIALIAAVVVAVNVGFAIAYVIAGGVENVRAGSLWDAFVFSVQTFGTIGYGVMNPRSDAANTIMAIESVTGIIVIAVITGLVFSKFARATARVAFSANAVVAKRDGMPTLVFRIGNRRSNRIVDARLRVTAALTTKTAEGEGFYKLNDLKLVRDRMSGLGRGWQVMHVIDETSPLYGKDAAALEAGELEIEIMVVGMDDVTMQTVHSLHVYTDKQVKHGYRFVDTMRTLPNGDLILDLRQFDSIVPDDSPRDSVAA